MIRESVRIFFKIIHLGQDNLVDGGGVTITAAEGTYFTTAMLLQCGPTLIYASFHDPRRKKLINHIVILVEIYCLASAPGVATQQMSGPLTCQLLTCATLRVIRTRLD